MSHDVFISYSTKDKTASDAVCATLEARGIRCWIAPRDILPGMDWTDAIIDALSGSRAFLLLLSSASNISEQVKREVQVAVSDGIPILPVRMEEFPLSKHMQYFIGTPHWLDAMTPPLEKHLQKVADTVAALLQMSKDSADLASVASVAPVAPTILPDALPAAPVAPAVVPSAVVASHWEPAMLAAIEVQLCAIIGPLGSLLVRRAAATSHTLDELHRKLMPHLRDENEQNTFRERSEAALGALETSAGEAPSGVAWPEQTLKKVERDLAEYIGPLARVLVKKSAVRASDLRELYQALADNIPDTIERNRFLKAGLK